MSNQGLKGKSTQNTVITSMLCALIVVFTFVPMLGYIRIFIVEATTIHIILILSAVLLGVRGGLVVGSAWGLSNWLYAMMRGSDPSVVYFNKPMVSVVPRILAGLLIALYFIAFSKIFSKTIKKENTARTVSIIVTSVLGTITHTFLVLTSMVIFSGDMSGVLAAIFSVNMLVNMIFEIVIAALLVPAISYPLSNIIKKNLKPLNVKRTKRKDE